MYDPESFGTQAFCAHARATGIAPSVPGMDYNCPKLLDSDGRPAQYTDAHGQLYHDIPALVYIKAMRAAQKGTFWVVTATHSMKSKVHYYNVKTVQPVLTPRFFYDAVKPSSFPASNNASYSNPFDDINNLILLPEFNRKRKREDIRTVGARAFPELHIEPKEDDE